MDPTVDQLGTPRTRWNIDRRLEYLQGRDVRAATDRFAAIDWQGHVVAPLSSVQELWLPDNQRPGGLPVFFEGRLVRFERRVGVVLVQLDALAESTRSTEGIINFRGASAVVLRGPAFVQLAFPFQVEPVPADPDNYWADLRVPRAQLNLPFDREGPPVLEKKHAAFASPFQSHQGKG